MGKFLSITVWFTTITLLVVCPHVNSQLYSLSLSLFLAGLFID